MVRDRRQHILCLLMPMLTNLLHQRLYLFRKITKTQQPAMFLTLGYHGPCSQNMTPGLRLSSQYTWILFFATDYWGSTLLNVQNYLVSTLTFLIWFENSKEGLKEGGGVHPNLFCHCEEQTNSFMK